MGLGMAERTDHSAIPKLPDCVTILMSRVFLFLCREYIIDGEVLERSPPHGISAIPAESADAPAPQH